MRIAIAERLRPFCHLPGASTIIPGSGYQIQVFPCLLRLYLLEGTRTTQLAEITFELKGPVEQFTVCNDLEKGMISVWGKTPQGGFRYHLISSKTSKCVRFLIDRVPSGGLSVIHQGVRHLLQPKEWLNLFEDDADVFEPFQFSAFDRLSLGCHKLQDWELVKRRLCLSEILPFWHRLGQMIPSVESHDPIGTLALLESCRQAFLEKKPVEAQQMWLNFVRAGFHSLLVPRLEDNDYQGLTDHFSEAVGQKISPLILLSEGSRLIRQLFVQQRGNEIHILPLLLPSLSCGRLIDVRLEGGGTLSLEWTKKTVRRMILFLKEDQEIDFRFRSDVRHFRLRENTKDRGIKCFCRSSLKLKKNYHYLIDNFE